MGHQHVTRIHLLSNWHNLIFRQQKSVSTGISQLWSNRTRNVHLVVHIINGNPSRRVDNFVTTTINKLGTVNVINRAGSKFTNSSLISSVVRWFSSVSSWIQPHLSVTVNVENSFDRVFFMGMSDKITNVVHARFGHR